MPTKRDRFNEPIPPNAVCARCGRGDRPLKCCRLTGHGDHPRYFYLCDEDLKLTLDKSVLPEGNEWYADSIMTEEEKRRETRRQKTFDRLGTDHPMCAFCTETDQRCMEYHHIAGKDFDEAGIDVCRNCHRKLSDMQYDHPKRLGKQPVTLETIGRFLLGVADMFGVLADKLREFGKYLIELARRQCATAKPLDD